MKGYMKITETFTFKKGEKIHLDEICDIQGLGDGEWWEHENHDCGVPSDEIRILNDVKIKIICDIK